jgi:uncharacterized protein YecE (DUF72 family)
MTAKPALRLGTSAFIAAGWEGTFYPAGMKPADFLSHYATVFDTVEVDSTYYRVPSPAMVRGWREKTPKGFLFAAKVPGEITHEKVLVDCDGDLRRFLDVMDILGEKLGPLLFQFPYFNKKAFATVDDFLARLGPFLKKLPRGYRFAVETRNKNFLGPRLLDLLRARGVALVLIDHPWMPRPAQILAQMDPLTADFTYIRWLGDRKAIEEQTKVWDKTIVNRRRELIEWVESIRKFNQRSVDVFAFANNHYAGHAPDTIRQFWELWKKR